MGDLKWRGIAGLCLTLSLTTIFTLADPIEKRPLDEPILYGLRVFSKEALVDYEPSGTVIVEPNVRIRIQAFGQLLAGVKAVLFTTSHDLCEPFVASASEADFGLDQEHTITFNVSLPKDQTTYYICFSFEDMPSVQYHLNRSLPLTRFSEFIHQGNVPYVTIKTKRRIKEYYMDMWLQITVVVVLLILSGLFSGLNLGLMSLEKTELKILLKVGDARERSYAQKIYPIRKSGNYLLCTLLLGNVFVNSSISILFDDLTTGYVALIVASIGIVIFGEIVPQAICTRYGLAVGAHTVFLTRIFMFLTFPLSYPISRILDKVMGEEVSRQVYNRERLLELIRMSKEQEGDLKNCQEVQIVTGALELSKKVVRDVMTNIKDVYMMPSDATLDPHAVSEIVKSGYTRIPVFDPITRHIVFILNVKDLALLDPEDKIPLMTICQFYQHPVRFVIEDSPLNVMLEEFKKGHYHLAIVQRINCEGAGDPVYEAVGLVSLEDIIEEIIQSEIRDEFDVIRDSRLKRMRRKETLAAIGCTQAATAKDLAMFFNTDIDACDVSPQLTLATYQYLSTNLEAFKRNFMNENVLLRLIRQNVIKAKPADSYEQPKYLFQKGFETDQFILILEGKCLITIGESNMIFEPGPFHYFGYEILAKIVENLPKQASLFSSFANSKFDNHNPTATSTPFLLDACGSLLSGNLGSYKFTPDFSLKITQETIYFKVTAATYVKAYRATLIERGLSFGNDYAKTRRKKQSSMESAKDNNFAETEAPDLGSSMPNIGASVAVSSDVGGGGLNVSSLFDETIRRETAVSTENVERLGDAVNHSDHYSVSGSHGVRHPICAIPRINTTRSMDEQSMERKRSLPSRCYLNGCTVNCRLNNDVGNKNGPFKSPMMDVENGDVYCEHVAGNGSTDASNSKRRRTLSNDKLLSNGGLRMTTRTALDDEFSSKTGNNNCDETFMHDSNVSFVQRV